MARLSIAHVFASALVIPACILYESPINTRHDPGRTMPFGLRVVRPEEGWKAGMDGRIHDKSLVIDPPQANIQAAQI